MQRSNSATTGLVALLIGALAGGIGGYSIGKGMEETTDMATPAPAATMALQNSDGVTVGGAKMVRTMDIVDNAANASTMSTLVSLIGLADLSSTLKGDGPFTVFAPDNNAFAKLPAATVASLQEPANKTQLAGILTYHVVSGTYTSADLAVMAGKGQTLTTVAGERLTPVLQDGMLKLRDAMGGLSSVSTADIISSNGVTHVVDTVLMPS